MDSIAGYAREQAVLMATETNTPISYFYEMPIEELVEWIRTANRAFENRRKNRDK